MQVKEILNGKVVCTVLMTCSGLKYLECSLKVSEDVLIPYEWIEIANENWHRLQEEGFTPVKSCRLGSDVAGMGRDDSVLCPRYGNYVPRFEVHQSAGKADHMHVAGMHIPYLKDKKAKAFIDTIGEGAGVYSRLEELGYKNAYSCKYSEGARELHDITGQYEFSNMRAYCYWSLRDWLNPKNGFGAALPPCDKLMEEVTETHWKFQSDGRIIIEPKEEIKNESSVLLTIWIHWQIRFIRMILTISVTKNCFEISCNDKFFVFLL